jgi:hypothetical protein
MSVYASSPFCQRGFALSGDRRMVTHTEAEIRRMYARRYNRVVHKGEWLDRIR